MRTRRLLIGAIVAVMACAMLSRAATAGEIERRKERQQQRIQAGEKSGKLSPGEAARIEKKEDALNREEQAMKDEHGGHLTKGERRMINRQQNQLSRNIHRQKHDKNNK